MSSEARLQRAVDKIYPALTALISRASSDSVVTLSKIYRHGWRFADRGLDTVLQKKLTDDGYGSPESENSRAGFPALRRDRRAQSRSRPARKENQWQVC